MFYLNNKAKNEAIVGFQLHKNLGKGARALLRVKEISDI
jgi:hypothetical protein